jgi:hypothetical protein
MDRKSTPAEPLGGGIQLRLGRPLLDLVENWRRAQPKIPPRSAAVRALLQRALKAEQRDAAS